MLYRALLATAMLFIAPQICGAYETDQFNNRLDPIEDATQLFNDKVNTAIEQIVADWRGPENQRKMVDNIFHTLGGHHWVDKIERWAMKAPEVQRLKTPRRDSIYSGHPFWATRVASLFGVGPTIKINHHLIGSDKLGHFFSQGRKFYRRYLKYESEQRAAERSAYTERAIFGQFTTGSYSNADLVANYEGYLFYRSLFEDNVIPGKPAILRWNGQGWDIQRPFDWADHINAYWDEALNISHYDRLLYKHMKKRLQSFCPEYHQQPALYQVEDEQQLRIKYQYLQLRDTSDLRLSRLCTETGPGTVISTE